MQLSPSESARPHLGLGICQDATGAHTTTGRDTTSGADATGADTTPGGKGTGGRCSDACGRADLAVAVDTDGATVDRTSCSSAASITANASQPRHVATAAWQRISASDAAHKAVLNPEVWERHLRRCRAAAGADEVLAWSDHIVTQRPRPRGHSRVPRSAPTPYACSESEGDRGEGGTGVCVFVWG